jgi:hypothetical protein
MGRPSGVSTWEFTGGVSRRSMPVRARPAPLTMHFTQEAIERFWSYVQKTDGCWEWTGPKFQSGYGILTIKRKMHRAHRASVVLHGGEIPNAMVVMHKCDNPGCVRPEHLTVGTVEENNRDRDRKGRTARGEQSGQRLHPERTARGSRQGLAKLTEDKVVELRRRAAGGEKLADLAIEFGVNKSTVSAAVSGQTWAHVTRK